MSRVDEVRAWWTDEGDIALRSALKAAQSALQAFRDGDGSIDDLLSAEARVSEALASILPVEERQTTVEEQIAEAEAADPDLCAECGGPV